MESQKIILSEHIATMANGKRLRSFLTIPGNWSVFCSAPMRPAWDGANIGKWLIAGIDVDLAMALCCKAVVMGATDEAKHTMPIRPETRCIACFYANADSPEDHRRLLDFLKQEKAIPKKKDGTYCNISFKYDQQTLNGEYGSKFKPRLRLSDFLNLATGEWIYPKKEDDKK